jgi:phosphatidylserine/phosphatidylglycerophosphate/cardiolipin synthase-like enzyme
MASELKRLKEKWFISFPDARPPWFPGAKRAYSFPRLEPHTDGNDVTEYLDASAYMADWARWLFDVSAADGGGVLLYSGWQFTNVALFGKTKKEYNAFDILEREARAGKLRAFALISDHVSDNVEALTAALVQVIKDTFTTWRPMSESLSRRSIQDHVPRANIWDACRLHARGLRTVLYDRRFPDLGSAHQKFSVIYDRTDATAFVGIDISDWRWDTPEHRGADEDRGDHGATHDLGISIRGPATNELVECFQVRWENSTSETWVVPIGSFLACPNGTVYRAPPWQQLRLPGFVPTHPKAGSQSIQVLQTYGRTDEGYSWITARSGGEFTIWRAYLNAIRMASKYIYIEDQYFLPFGSPPYFSAGGAKPSADDLMARSVDVIHSLGEALQRGVSVVVILPAGSEDKAGGDQQYHQMLGIRYLRKIAEDPKAGRFLAASPIATSPPVSGDPKERVPHFVHAKVLICDDEYVLIGSANVCLRSFSHDGELSVGIVDGESRFALRLRRLLWEHHAGAPSAIDVSAALSTLRKSMDAGRRLREYRVPPTLQPPPFPPGVKGKILKAMFGTPEDLHDFMMTAIIDPYAGPNLKSEAWES